MFHLVEIHRASSTWVLLHFSRAELVLSVFVNSDAIAMDVRRADIGRRVSVLSVESLCNKTNSRYLLICFECSVRVASVVISI